MPHRSTYQFLAKEDHDYGNAYSINTILAAAHDSLGWCEAMLRFERECQINIFFV